ncbi:MAG TPA: hypothetical protein VFV99_10730 [Kofleriaceae bacterium]|nr:hypothetical protein [Kofleriaceae bacterium]
MSRVLLVVGVLGLCSAEAMADPQVRFGMTFGVDRNVPEAHEFGPMFGIGMGAGRFTGELNYSYLSMFDQATRVHRAGVTLRMDFVRTSWDMSDQSKAFYGEVGAARRFGYWSVDDLMPVEDKSQNELQLAVGYELANDGGAWQLALRFGFARRDPELGSACRGVACPVAMPASTGLAESAMLEWTWLLNRGH